MISCGLYIACSNPTEGVGGQCIVIQTLTEVEKEEDKSEVYLCCDKHKGLSLRERRFHAAITCGWLCITGFL